MKVLHLLGTGRPGGVETFVLQLCEASRDGDVQNDVCIIGPGGSMVGLLEQTGSLVTTLDTSRSGKALAAARLITIVRRGAYDIVHAHSGGRLPRLIARQSGARVISHVHGLDADWIGHAAANDGFWQKRVNEVGFRADEIAVSSEYMAGLITAAGSRRPVVQMRYGVNTSRFAPPSSDSVHTARQRLGLPESARVVGFVGRLVPQKGLSHVLALASALSTEAAVYVVIVGDGTLRSDLEKTIAEQELANVILAGETVAPHETMAAFDMTVITSEWEPFGIVGIESQSMGIPVVAFDVGGLPEVIVDGSTGILVRRGDIHGLRTVVNRLLDNLEARRSLGTAGRARALKEFDTRQTSKAVFDHYNDLMGESH